jgi:NAD(P)-dependent dehydrogenase (short-subunit alcohol dehydrogenase family)
MTIEGSVAFVTGGNRGLGGELVRGLVEAGASKVYAAARDPRTVKVESAVPVKLDITDHASVLAAAEQAKDVTLLINCAGILTHGTNALDGDFEVFRREFETNVLGTLDVARAFAPILARNGGGALVNVLSVTSWGSAPGWAAYCASKSAEWSITNTLRLELAAQNTRVTAVHASYVNTGMIDELQGVEKADPADIARIALEGIGRGELEVATDDFTRQVKAGLALSIEDQYPQLAQA